MEKKASRSAVALVAFFGLLVAYPVSVGPAALLSACVPSDGFNDAIATIYEPLTLLPDALATPIGKWADLWLRWAPDPGPLPCVGDIR